MVDFSVPNVYKNPEGWGPPPDSEIEALGFGGLFNCAYEHLDKYPLQRIGRICDFTASGQRFAEQRAAKGKGKGLKGKGPQLLAPGKDEEGFALVDNRPMPGKTFSRGRGFGKGRGKKGMAVNDRYQEGILGQKQKPFNSYNMNQVKGKGKGGRGGGQQRRGLPSFKEWSVQTKTEWPMKREIPLNQLGKLQLDAREVKFEDLRWCGQLHQYNRDFDKITINRERPLRRFEELGFFNITAQDDPLLTHLVQSDPEIQVISTDHVLACLIAASRSIYSWDILITKLDGRLFFDKRDGSQVDFLSVNETAPDPPNNDDKESINSPIKLSQEATCINQNFSQMVLDENSAPEAMQYPNPFDEEGEASAASGAYRYRKITLPGNPKDDKQFNARPVVMAVRTEVNCKVGSDSYASVKALNEFDPKPNYSWRKHLEAQRGMVLATELKNNGFKIGRWVAQAILAGCDVMKIGYASRSRPENPWNHSILGVEKRFTDQFAEQIGISRNNTFGILRAIIDQIMEWDDGKYLLIKDPMKSIIRIFEVPWETFGEEEDADAEEQEGSDEGEEVDEEGNPVPAPQSVGPAGGDR